MHIRKLYLTGSISGRDPADKYTNYYSWPKGENYRVVEEIIKSFKKAFCNTSVILIHMYED